MNVLMISGDRKILEEGSDARARLQLQRSQVDRLDVCVWPRAHSFRVICKVAHTNRPDVVTAQDPFWRGLLAWHIARHTGARLNIQVHADLSAQSCMRRSLARFTLARANSIRVVSEKLGAQVRSFGAKAPIYVLPVYVDASSFTGLTPLPHRQKTILWIGRFEPEKDPQSAITILKEVREKGIDAKLIMLGSGTLGPVLRKAAKDLPVEFPGWQDPKEYLRIADAVLSTSRSESWGASIIEALAAGVPVVARDVGVAREAGARVPSHERLGEALCEVLATFERGVLKLKLPSASEWARQWRETLI